jgi:hypothetical protein
MTRRRRTATAAADAGAAAPGPPPWIAWLFLALLLAAGLALWGRQRFEFDDAYISYRYAHNLTSGHGLVFNPGDRVEGYSNLLWVVILAAGERAGIAPHRLGPALGVLSYLSLLAASWYAVWRGVRGWSTRRRVWGTALLFALVLMHGLAAAAGSGLETMFFALLVLKALGSWALSQEQPRRLRPATAVLLSLLLLTRDDGVIPVACLLVLDAIRERRRAGGLIAGCRATLGLAWLPAATFALHAAWRLLSYGSWFPNPYFAKAADVPHYAAGFAYLGAFLLSYPALVVLAPAAALFCLRRRGAGSAASFALAACVVAIVSALYLARVGGDFMDYRLAWHFLPALALAGIVGLVELAPAGGAAAGAMAALILGLSLAPVRLESSYAMQSLDTMQRYVDQGTSVGRALSVLPRDTVVATTLIGTIGYYSGLRIVDQWGLVDAGVRSRPARDKFERGHVKFLPARGALDAGADLYFEHPDLCPCDRGSLRTEHEVALRLADGGCVRALVISPREGFRAAICADRTLFPVIGREVCGP